MLILENRKTILGDGENRSVRWECGTNVITMVYDRMGRRVSKNDQTFIYDGYLQIADNRGSCYIWDPTEPVATRPLVRNNSEFYFHDGNKNVSDILSAMGSLVSRYDYAPFGDCTTIGSNPWRFSSEYSDDDLGLIYYIYRHYEPKAGRWMSRDPIGESNERKSLIVFCANNNNCFDYLGLEEECCCKVCLYSAVPWLFMKSGPIDVSEGMFGHTWVNLESCSVKDDEFGQSSTNNAFSFGPKESNTNKKFFWGVPGKHWEVDDYTNLTVYAVAKKCWSRTAEECEKIKEDLKSPYPKEFSLSVYCTNTAVDFLRRHGIDAPNGVGEIKMPWWFPNVNRANPKDMYMQIISAGGVNISKVQEGF